MAESAANRNGREVEPVIASRAVRPERTDGALSAATTRPSGGRRTAAASLAAVTALWIGSLIHIEGSVAGAVPILLLAAAVAALCFSVHCLVGAAARRGAPIADTLVFSHFLQGVLVFTVYVLLYVLEPSAFLRSWRSLYFGYYIYDIAVLLLCWRRLYGSFRVFYSVHHTVSFAITSLWMLVGGAWLDYIVLGVVLWLGSDLWVYGLALYRNTRRRELSRLQVARLQLRIFWIERVHRGAAYLIPCILASFQLSTLAIVIFATGLANDILDASFQWRTIQRKLRRGAAEEAEAEATGSSLRPESRPCGQLQAALT